MYGMSRRSLGGGWPFRCRSRTPRSPPRLRPAPPWRGVPWPGPSFRRRRRTRSPRRAGARAFAPAWRRAACNAPRRPLDQPVAELAPVALQEAEALVQRPQEPDARGHRPAEQEVAQSVRARVPAKWVGRGHAFSLSCRWPREGRASAARGPGRPGHRAPGPSRTGQRFVAALGVGRTAQAFSALAGSTARGPRPALAWRSPRSAGPWLGRAAPSPRRRPPRHRPGEAGPPPLRCVR